MHYCHQQCCPRSGIGASSTWSIR
ncbi:UNVERIFIED_CONTAM: hypothetical protein GTU68_042080 [Idotea baltica]|nr:hypothetical protein [Idotea baltica]